MIRTYLQDYAAVLANYFDMIPDDRWMMWYAGSKDGSKSCAWGHLVREDKYMDAAALELILGPFPEVLSTFNNGTSGTKYDILGTPRERVVAVLRDISKGEFCVYIYRRLDV